MYLDFALITAGIWRLRSGMFDVAPEITPRGNSPTRLLGRGWLSQQRGRGACLSVGVACSAVFVCRAETTLARLAITSCKCIS